jgi:glycosyltransferase involved in cell wall biosynthesis
VGLDVLRAMTRPWVVLREGARLRWGGDLRRHYLLESLAQRTGARTTDACSARSIAPVLAPGLKGMEVPWVASSEFLDSTALPMAHERGKLLLLDVHDDSVIQHDAAGIVLTSDERASLELLLSDNIGVFRLYSVPGETLATRIGLDPSRTHVALNGTDTRVVRPGPWPTDPAIAMVSGAGPGRGIEMLIDAARALRHRHELRLLLLLLATNDASQVYLDQLKARCSSVPWIEISSARYDELGARLANATVVCAPHPPHPYWDAASPVKISDYLSAGRPVVTTPRLETMRLFERIGGGVVCEDDSLDSLVAALDRVLSNETYARALGERARTSAEQQLDWARIGDELASWVLDRAE